MATPSMTLEEAIGLAATLHTDRPSCETRGGSGRGGRQRKASTEPGSHAPRPKKVKTAAAAGCAASQWHLGEANVMSFDAARAIVRALKLGSSKEWNEYSKSGKRPSNIPSAPDKVYRNAGWTSWHDWLGCGVTL